MTTNAKNSLVVHKRDRTAALMLGIVFFAVISDIAFAEQFAYDSKGRRDPFLPLTGPESVSKPKGAADIESVEDVSLEGIVYDSKGATVAVLNGMVVKEGDQVGRVTVSKIEQKKIVLLIDGTQYEIPLAVEKGSEQ